MNREEAIKEIRHVFVKDFADEILKALEQEPCEDAISRQAVLDLVVANHTELNGLNVVMYSPLYKDIKQLPPVNSQPKTGHWISEVTCIGAKIYRCSNCDFTIPKPKTKINYCSNCGSKMEEEE